MAVSLLVVFLYGSTLWNMFPVTEIIDPNISWEGHLSGALSGLICAALFRQNGPQKPEDSFDEPEEDENPEEELPQISDETGLAETNVVNSSEAIILFFS
jgi:hypothetical protein